MNFVLWFALFCLVAVLTAIFAVGRDLFSEPDYEQDDYSPDETWVQPELRFSSQGRVLRIERYDEGEQE